MKAYLHRNHTVEATYGELTVKGLIFYTLELPWLENKTSISCIPAGIYPLELIESPSQGLCYSVKDVPDRKYILIHVANYTRELRGCIAPAMDQKDIDKDGIVDNVSSRIALEALIDLKLTSIEITH